jgi:hypothetical protein
LAARSSGGEANASIRASIVTLARDQPRGVGWVNKFNERVQPLLGALKTMG